MNNIKQKIIDEIKNNVDIFYPVPPIRYRIRCPFCGDSQEDPRDAHLYLKCSFDPNEPIVYKCFKCNSKGKVTQWFLNKLNIKLNGLSELENQVFNKISSIKKIDVDIITGPPIINSNQSRYIEKRLGRGFTIEDYDRFKIIWDMNAVIPYITDMRIKNTLPSNWNSISFLSDEKSTLLTRFFSDEDPRWKKTKLFSLESKSFYTIKSTLNLFTKDQIVVNIGEGVFDVLSIYKNFNDGDNSVYIAVLGSDYESGVEYAINKGFIGDNVILKIYIDSNIDERVIQHQMKKYKWLYNKIYVYKNIQAEDFGYPIEKIKPIIYKV